MANFIKMKKKNSIMSAPLESRKIGKKHIFNIIIIILLIILLLNLFIIFFSNTDEITKVIYDSKNFAPIIIILLIILEVVIAPIPGTLIMISTGYIYGFFWGSVICYIGNVIGTTIAFFLSRKFGRPFISKIVSQKKIEYYDKFLSRHHVLLWIVYAIPIFPIDIISFAVGSSNMRFRKFFLVISLALIPNLFIINYIGDKMNLLGAGKSIISYFAFATVLIFILLLIFNAIKKDKNIN